MVDIFERRERPNIARSNIDQMLPKPPQTRLIFQEVSAIFGRYFGGDISYIPTCKYPLGPRMPLAAAGPLSSRRSHDRRDHTAAIAASLMPLSQLSPLPSLSPSPPLRRRRHRHRCSRCHRRRHFRSRRCRRRRCRRHCCRIVPTYHKYDKRRSLFFFPELGDILSSCW